MCCQVVKRSYKKMCVRVCVCVCVCVCVQMCRGRLDLPVQEKAAMLLAIPEANHGKHLQVLCSLVCAQLLAYAVYCEPL